MSEGPHQRSGNTRREKSRRAIIEAATQLLTDVGDQASMVAVAERAGISEATVYNHFPTKPTLIAAAYGELFIGASEWVRLRQNGQPTPDVLLWDYLRHATQLARNHLKMTALFMAAYLADTTLFARQPIDFPLGQVIVYGQKHGSFLADLDVKPIAQYHTVGMLARVVATNDTDAPQMADALRAQILPVLTHPVPALVLRKGGDVADYLGLEPVYVPFDFRFAGGGLRDRYKGDA